MANKLVKGKPFLNDFHKKSIEESKKAVESYRKRSHSWKEMKEQADWLENRFKKQNQLNHKPNTKA